MKKYNNVVYGKTLKKYQKKYGKHSDSLISFTESELEKYNLENKPEDYDYLLKGRKWWYIKGTYYEVRRRINTKGLKVLLPLLLGGGAVAGVVVAVLYNLKDTKPGEIIEKKYNVTYDANGGLIEGQSKKTVQEKEIIQVAPNATKQDYLLEGWYKDATCNPQDRISFPYRITGDTSLYAKWVAVGKLNTVLVNFDVAPSTTAINPMYIKKGLSFSDYGELSKPTLMNNKFIGWSYKKDTYDPVVKTKAINDNLTLYAHFEQNEFDLTLKTTGAKPAGTVQVAPNTYKYETKISSLNIEPESKAQDNYGFRYWKNKNGVPISYPFKLKEDTTIEADYVQGEVTYTATFVDNGVTYGQPLTNRVNISTPPTEGELLAKTPRTGIKLVGWKIHGTNDANIVDFKKVGGYILTADTQFDAIWKPCEFEVKLIAVTPEGKEEKETRDKCGYLSKQPDFVVTDHELQKPFGWYDNEALEGDPIDFTNGYEITKNCSLYGKYIRSDYNVDIYQDDGTTKITTLKHVSSLYSSDLPRLTKTNHDLNWQYKKDGAWVDIKFNTETPTEIGPYCGADKTLTLKAFWGDKVRYDLKLHYPTYVQSNEITLSEQKHVTLSSLENYKYPCESKKCTGWSLTDGGTPLTLDFDINKDTTIYAIYETQVFNLTIDLKSTTGESLGNSITDQITYGTHNLDEEFKVKINDSIRTSSGTYDFTKWQIDGKDATVVDIKSDKTITAVYSKKHTAKVYMKTKDTTEFKPILDYSSGVTKVNYNNIINELNKMGGVPSGYVLQTSPKWQYRIGSTGEFQSIGDKIDEFNITQDDTQIIVTIVQDKFTLTFENSNGSTILMLQDKKNGDVINNSEVPTAPTEYEETEFIFNGWGIYHTEVEPPYVGDIINFKSGYVLNTDRNITFRPVFDKKMNVKFNVNDVTQAWFENGDTKHYKTAAVNNITEINQDSYTEKGYSLNFAEGYSLNCWVDENGNKINFPITDGDSKVKNLYALLNKDASKCTVLLNAGDGKFEGTTTPKELMLTPNINSTLGELISSSGYKVPRLEGFKLDKWQIYNSATKQYIDIDNNYVFTSNIFLYAHYVEDVDTSTTKADLAKFQSDNWATIDYWANQGANAFVQHYNFKSKLSDFVGVEKNVKINGTNYTAKIVGTEYDKIDSTSNYCLLTFAMANTPFKSFYNPSMYTGKSNNWAKSLTRKRFLKNDDSTYYNQMDRLLNNHVKNVNKYTRYGTDDTSIYKTSETTVDNYFLFSGYELGYDVSSSTYKKYFDSVKEGNTTIGKYPYFSSDGNRILKCLGNNSEYWVRSPINSSFGGGDGVLGSAMNWIQSSGQLKTCNEFNSSWDYYADTPKGINFGFALGINI